MMTLKELEKGCILTPKLFTCNKDLNLIDYFERKMNDQIPLEIQS